MIFLSLSIYLLGLASRSLSIDCDILPSCKCRSKSTSERNSKSKGMKPTGLRSAYFKMHPRIPHLEKKYYMTSRLREWLDAPLHWIWNNGGR